MTIVTIDWWMKITKLFLVLVLVLSSCEVPNPNSGTSKNIDEHIITKAFGIPLGGVWKYGLPPTLKFKEYPPFEYKIQQSGPGWKFLEKDTPFHQFHVMICPHTDRIIRVKGISSLPETFSEASMKEQNDKMLFLLSTKYGKEGLDDIDYSRSDDDGETWRRIQYLGIGRRENGKVRRQFSVWYSAASSRDTINRQTQWGENELFYPRNGSEAEKFEKDPEKYRRAFQQKVKEAGWKYELDQI